MTTKTLGESIRKRRKELGMTQQELALVSGTAARFISDLENGKETCVLGKTLNVLENLGLELRLVPRGKAEDDKGSRRLPAYAFGRTA